VGIATRDLFLSWYLPRPLWGLLEPSIYAMMDEPLLDAFGFPKPSQAMRRFVEAPLKLRARFMRLLPDPQRPTLRTQARHRTYPTGYRIEDLGPSQPKN
jgi:hypothetical protein